MALDFRNYSAPIMEGALIHGTAVATGNITGAHLTLTKSYVTIVATTNGPGPVNVFGSATAPVNGTIVGVIVANATTSLATLIMNGTTAGSITGAISVGTQSINGAAIASLTTTTGVLNAAVVAGDTVTINGGAAGTATAYISFISVN